LSNSETKPSSPPSGKRKAALGVAAALLLSSGVGAETSLSNKDAIGIEAIDAPDQLPEAVPSTDVESKPKDEVVANDVVDDVVSSERSQPIKGEIPHVEDCVDEIPLNELIKKVPEKGISDLEGVRIQAFRPVDVIIENQAKLYIFRPGDTMDEGILLSDVYNTEETQKETLEFARTTQAVVDAAILPIYDKLPEERRPRFVEIEQSSDVRGCVAGTLLAGASANSLFENQTLEMVINETGQVDAIELFEASSHEIFHFAYQQVQGLFPGAVQNYDEFAEEFYPFNIERLNSMYEKFASTDSIWMGKHLNLLLGAGKSVIDDNQSYLTPDSLSFMCYPGRVDAGTTAAGTTLFSVVDESSYFGAGPRAGHPYSNPDEFFASTANTLRLQPNSFQATIETLPDGYQRQLLVELAALTFDLSKMAFTTNDAGLGDIFEPGLVRFIRKEAKRLEGKQSEAPTGSDSYCYYHSADKVISSRFGLEKVKLAERSEGYEVTQEELEGFKSYVKSVNTKDARETLPQDAHKLNEASLGGLEYVEWRDMMNSYGLHAGDEWSDPKVFMDDLQAILDSGAEISQEVLIPLITYPLFTGNGRSYTTFEPLKDSYLFELAKIHKFSVNEAILYLSKFDTSLSYSEDSAQVLLLILEDQLTAGEFQVAAKELRDVIKTTKQNEILSYGSYSSLDYWLKDRGF